MKLETFFEEALVFGLVIAGICIIIPASIISLLFAFACLGQIAGWLKSGVWVETDMFTVLAIMADAEAMDFFVNPDALSLARREEMEAVRTGASSWLGLNKILIWLGDFHLIVWFVLLQVIATPITLLMTSGENG